MGEVSERSLASEKTSILELLPHKLNKMKKTVLKRLSIKEFDAALLEKLTKEGRVFISCPQATDQETYKREVLDYVQNIREFASKKWQMKIDGLWQAIVDAPCFSNSLKMKNGMQAGHMNRYVITNIVCRMQNNGIYREDVSMQTLHLRMEGVRKKNKYYCSCGNYLLTKTEKDFLKELFQRV